MPDNIGFPLFVLAVLIFMGWFVIGTQWNVRKGDAVLKWLRQGLPLVGERSTMRWLGSSVIELKIAKAKDPFRTVETLVVFEPRDVVFIWAFFRLRGRRDLVIFRAQLRSAPTFELEVFDPRAWTAHSIARDVQKKNWTALEASESAIAPQAYFSGGDPATARSLIALATRTGAKLTRLSVHRDVPNLEVQWLLPDVTSQTARDLFSKLRQLGEEVAHS